MKNCYFCGVGACRLLKLGHNLQAGRRTADLHQADSRGLRQQDPAVRLEEDHAESIEEFLKNGEYTVSPENAAQGVIVGEISHYILTPIQYDVNLVPTVYKLNVIAGLRLLDREQNRYLWEEPALQVTKMYSAATLPGGLTEEQAREALWEILAKDVMLRTVGFGSVSSASLKKLPGNPEVQHSSGTVAP
jgi:hypothetical protein